MGKRKTEKRDDTIIIDEKKGLSFQTEDELYKHFFKEISFLEEEFFKVRSKNDLAENDFEKYEENLGIVLDDPDEVWEDEDTIKGTLLTTFIRKFDAGDDDENDNKEEQRTVYHVAIAYMADGAPSFVYLHFPSTSAALIGIYKRGNKVFDRLDQTVPFGALEGDALYEGDEFARGLYQSMLKVRSESDIKEEKFRRFAGLREESIEQPDEIWRNNDTLGNVLVSFIREFPDESGKDMYYVVVTIEDTPSNSHALLFSFPTTDESLVARYRNGENLQAEEVVQEASH